MYMYHFDCVYACRLVVNNRRRGRNTDGANGSGGGAGTTNGDVTGAGDAHLAIEVHVYTRMCTVQVFSYMYL